MKNIRSLAGMISILALAYALDLLLSLWNLGFFGEDLDFLSRRNVWLLPISFTIFSLSVLLLAWYVVWHSKPAPFVRFVFLIVGIVGLLLPTILHALYASFGYNNAGFLIAEAVPLLSTYLRSPFLFYQTFAYLTVIGAVSMFISRDSAN